MTLLGQSSGGTSIFALLTSPLAAGLFHRAWAASGSPTMNKTMQQASKDNLVFLNTTGCGDVTCLRGLSPLELLRSTPWYVFPYWMMDDLLELPEKGRLDGALIVVDGKRIVYISYFSYSFIVLLSGLETEVYSEENCFEGSRHASIIITSILYNFLGYHVNVEAH